MAAGAGRYMLVSHTQSATPRKCAVQAVRNTIQAASWRDAAMGRNDHDRLRQEEWDGPVRTYFGFWSEADWASNFHASPFVVDWRDDDGAMSRMELSCSEQWFMFRKAWRFGDADAMRAVAQPGLAPYRYKTIGRGVAGFDEKVWSDESRGYMFEALLFKFTQNPELARRLLDTGDQVLVECSPFDTIWGVGLGKRTENGSPDDRWRDSGRWRGKNHLGFLLMDVRDVLRSDRSPFDFKYGGFIDLIPAFDQPAESLYTPPRNQVGAVWFSYGEAVDEWWRLIDATPGCTDCYRILDAAGIDPTRRCIRGGSPTSSPCRCRR